MEEKVVHTIEPVYEASSRILILGSFPSVASRAQNFFYGHKQNRFWSLMKKVFDVQELETIEQKKAFLLEHNIALWDTIYSCTITGSSDASIKDVVPTDIASLIANSSIQRVICNGSTAGRLYAKYQAKQTHLEAVVMPSTSPANAAWSLERLYEAWKVALTLD